MEKMKTRDRILMAALDLFSEKGYEETSIDMLAETVGIKGPSIYAHYRGKAAILDALIAQMEERYDKNFGNVANLQSIPDSLSEFQDECMRQVDFTMQDPQIQKVRKFCAIEQHRNKKIAALTSKHQLTGNQEMYAVILEKLMKKKLIRQNDPKLLALELVAPVTVMIEIADREPERTEEMRTQIKEHLSLFVQTYRLGDK